MPTLKYTVLKILLESDHPQLPISFYHFPGQNLFAIFTYVPTKASKNFALQQKMHPRTCRRFAQNTPSSGCSYDRTSNARSTDKSSKHYADKDHLYTFLNMLGLDLIGQEIIHKNLFKFKTRKKKSPKQMQSVAQKHILCLMQPKQLQTKS